MFCTLTHGCMGRIRKKLPTPSFLSPALPWVQSRIRCEPANPPLVQFSTPSSGSTAATPSAAAINVLRSERGRQSVAVCYGREPFLLSCIFHQLVLLSGPDPSDWLTVWRHIVCVYVCTERRVRKHKDTLFILFLVYCNLPNSE